MSCQCIENHYYKLTEKDISEKGACTTIKKEVVVQNEQLTDC